MVAPLTIWSITLIDNSEVGVIKIFGETEESELAPGVHAVAPWKNVISYTRRVDHWTSWPRWQRRRGCQWCP